jgi:hypothetical protein
MCIGCLLVGRLPSYGATVRGGAREVRGEGEEGGGAQQRSFH